MWKCEREIGKERSQTDLNDIYLFFFFPIYIMLSLFYFNFTEHNKISQKGEKRRNK